MILHIGTALAGALSLAFGVAAFMADTPRARETFASLATGCAIGAVAAGVITFYTLGAP